MVYYKGVEMRKIEKDERVNLRISKKDKKLLEKDAKEEERTVTSLLVWCWKEWRKKGR